MRPGTFQPGDPRINRAGRRRVIGPPSDESDEAVLADLQAVVDGTLPHEITTRQAGLLRMYRQDRVEFLIRLDRLLWRAERLRWRDAPRICYRCKRRLR